MELAFCYLKREFVIVVQLLSNVQLFVTPWTVALQAALSMGLSRQAYCHSLLYRIFPTQGSSLLWQAGSLPLSHQGSLKMELQIWKRKKLEYTTWYSGIGDTGVNLWFSTSLELIRLEYFKQETNTAHQSPPTLQSTVLEMKPGQNPGSYLLLHLLQHCFSKCGP